MKSLILPPLSDLYGAITRARVHLYNRGTFRTTRLDRPVISIGNLTTGGTGKTPLVEWVARVLAADGKRVCILTRGYGRRNPNRRVLVSDSHAVLSNPFDAGDEPFLLAKNLVGSAAVISDIDRVSAGKGAIEHLKTDCFILDDGFQHLRLARDLDIVTVDATNPWGGGELLPFGRLREKPDALKRADCLVITRSDQVGDVAPLVSEIRTVSGDRPIFISRMAIRRFARLDQDLEAEINGPVAAFCAVGNPDSFFKLLEQSGCQLVFKKQFADHHVYSAGDLQSLENDALNAGASVLVTTAKDAVKLNAKSFTLPSYVMEIELKIDNDDELARMIRLVGTGPGSGLGTTVELDKVI
ncbi:MAG TPA: tetraacyldisaccharide 4'-kinase [Pyrinomonadaceae bacterium]|nr:tetraacyldisaccharide 4'-kinase [Pyrinomonadaceae bacterium]